MMKKRELLVGVDGGGTSTRVWVVDPHGHGLGVGVAGPSNYQHAGIDGTTRAIGVALREALDSAKGSADEITAAFFGMAGVVNARDHAAIREALSPLPFPPDCARGIDHDIRIALSGGLAGAPGIALIAGTGSSCYGRNAEGIACQCGGWGSLVDDVGSAYWVGVEALKRAVREADGRCPHSPIQDAVFAAIGIESVRDFMNRVHGIGMKREEIAALCPCVVELAQKGDSVAWQILRAGCAALAELVAVVARKLKLGNPAVVLAGGLATSGPPFTPLLHRTIEEQVPGANLTTAHLPPVAGAVLEARRMVTRDGEDSFLNNLKRNTNPC